MIYGLKQAAKQYWKEILKCFGSMDYNRSKADPCLYFKWMSTGLILWMSWVDDLHVTGEPNTVKKEKQELMLRL